MIRAGDVMPLLLEACPSFESTWNRIEEENVDEESGTRLGYIDAGDFARHLIDMYRRGMHQEINAAFDVIERLHLEGDAYVSELATIGYLECLQFATSHVYDVDDVAFEVYLKPESRRWWNGLHAFWRGDPGAIPVRSLD